MYVAGKWGAGGPGNSKFRIKIFSLLILVVQTLTVKNPCDDTLSSLSVLKYSKWRVGWLPFRTKKTLLPVNEVIKNIFLSVYIAAKRLPLIILSISYCNQLAFRSINDGVQNGCIFIVESQSEKIMKMTFKVSVVLLTYIYRYI